MCSPGSFARFCRTVTALHHPPHTLSLSVQRSAQIVCIWWLETPCGPFSYGPTIFRTLLTFCHGGIFQFLLALLWTQSWINYFPKTATFLFIKCWYLETKIWGWQDGSVGTGACCQAVYSLRLIPRTHMEKGGTELTSEGCPLVAACVHACVQTHMHVHAHTHIYIHMYTHVHTK